MPQRHTNSPSGTGPAARRAALLLLFGGGIALALHISANADLTEPDVQVGSSTIYAMRECTATLAPSQTLGDDEAPRLIIVTSGRNSIQVELRGKSPLEEPTLVQSNVRSSFEFATDGSIDAFRRSTVGQAIMSGRVFFITVQLSDGTYVSSRYEAIAFDSVLARIQASCPFEAEMLMSNLDSQRAAERALNLSSDDLTMIRWDLLRKYEYQQEKPSETFSLSDQDREYLKRYALQNGLPVSSYLTSTTAKRLLGEAALLTPPPPPPPPPTPPTPPPPPSVQFTIANNTSKTVDIAFFDGADRHQIDPPSGRVYFQPAHSTHDYEATCIPDQLVCYGAVVEGLGLLQPFWGVGREGKAGCTGCCTTCPNSMAVNKSLNTSDWRQPPPTMTWVIVDDTSKRLSIAFYSDTRRNYGWPGWDRNWTVTEHENTYTLNCQEGEKICYGAWPEGNVNSTYWGVGPFRRQSCTNCCGECNGGTYNIRLAD